MKRNESETVGMKTINLYHKQKNEDQIYTYSTG